MGAPQPAGVASCGCSRAQLLWLWQGCSGFVSSAGECFSSSLAADLFLKQSSSLID